MIIRVYWPQRDCHNKTEPIDSFWVEATDEEAQKAIFPFLTPEVIEQSKTHARNGEIIASQIGNPPRPYCFLVAQDLSTIDPFDVHYPFHQMWGAYSPFRELAEFHINTLEELTIFMPLSNPIRFYHLNKPYGFFSNFAPYAIYLKGKIWPTSEHYFQAQKFVDTPHEEQIRQAQTPREAAQMGRDRTLTLRADWEVVKDDVMREALGAKFTQHPDLNEKLLATGNAEIVEHTTNDSYWGDGGDGSGKNMLGKLLMETRERIRNELFKENVS
ncbi:NADAR family protein [Nostoc parmelioides]